MPTKDDALAALKVLQDWLAPTPQPQAPSAVAQPAAPAPTYPRIEKIHGVNIMLEAPISPNWWPTPEDWVFGHIDGTQIADPSNGKRVGKPLRNEAGLPLIYPIGRGPNGEDVAAGPPAVLYGSQFDDSKVSAEQKAAIDAQWQAEWDALKKGGGGPAPTPTGETDVAIGTEP
jgi:hypothetical protein